MSTHFTLHPAELDVLAGQLETLHQTEADAIGQRLQRIQTGLQQSWAGPSADAFTAAFGDWTAKWRAICGNLTLISVFLREAAQQYRQLEDARDHALGTTERALWQARATDFSSSSGGGLTSDRDRPLAPGGGGLPGPWGPTGPGARPHAPVRPPPSGCSWIFEPGPGGPLFGVPAELACRLSSAFKEWLAAQGVSLEDLGRPLTFTPDQLRRLDRIWSQSGIDLPEEALREPLTLSPEQTRRFLEWAEPARVDLPERPITDAPGSDPVGHAALIRDPQTGLYHNWRGEVIDLSNRDNTWTDAASHLDQPTDARLTRERAAAVQAWISAGLRRGRETWPGLESG